MKFILNCVLRYAIKCTISAKSNDKQSFLFVDCVLLILKFTVTVNSHQNQTTISQFFEIHALLRMTYKI